MNFWPLSSSWLPGRLRRQRQPLGPSFPSHLPVLLVVEGPHDVEFLRRIGRMLHARDPDLSDLASLEQFGRLVFLPINGGNVRGWCRRLEALGKAEFHLYDCEEPPESVLREQAAAAINARPRCRAFVTAKRNLENYLHPHALREARGVEVQFGDRQAVASLVARHLYEAASPEVPWEELPQRRHRRLRERAKHWLNTEAADRMTPERLAARDPEGEVISWIRAIADLVGPAGVGLVTTTGEIGD